jgi:hypothetical protein
MNGDFMVVPRGYDRGRVDNTVRALVAALNAGGRFRSAPASALRLDRPSEQEILEEVRRLREAMNPPARSQLRDLPGSRRSSSHRRADRERTI